MLRCMYHTVPGRVLLKMLSGRRFSALCGRFMDSSLSRPLIRRFVRKNHIDLNEYTATRYRSFNDCFTRRIRAEMRPIPHNPRALIAPCDGRLSAYRISDGLVMPIKQSWYSVSDLLGGDPIAEAYRNGVCLVFRLCVDNYHRYCYIDNGTKGRNVFLPGQLHTVRPIALSRIPVFIRNCREYTVMDTAAFGPVTQIEVGALLVGKILNHDAEARVHRGAEKGMFLYGGSTIVLLLREGAADLPDALFEKKPRVVRKRPSAWAKYSVTRIKNKKLEGKPVSSGFPPVSPFGDTALLFPVSVRIHGLPAIGIPAHLIQTVLCVPAQHFTRQRRIGIAGIDIAGTARLNPVRHVPSGSGFKRLDNVQNGVTHTGADVVRLHPGDGTGTVQRHEMRPRQIYHVDIVADTGAVMGLVIIPVDVQIRALALRHLRDVGEQVVGNPLRILADEPRRMRADRVEVPQERNTPRGIRPVQIAQNALNHLFGLTVWVGCFSQPVGFPDRDALRRAVHRCGRTEYQFPHTVTAHGIAQVKCGKQVVPVVAGG